MKVFMNLKTCLIFSILKKSSFSICYCVSWRDHNSSKPDFDLIIVTQKQHHISINYLSSLTVACHLTQCYVTWGCVLYLVVSTCFFINYQGTTYSMFNWISTTESPIIYRSNELLKPNPVKIVLILGYEYKYAMQNTK